MHPNRIFHDKADLEILAMSRGLGFGTLLMNGSEFPMTAHVPFVINEDSSELECHLAINNPMRKALLGGCDAKVCVLGPHAYISPDWYGVEDQVPTWNYIATEICGFAKAQSAEWLEDHLAQLSAHHEARLSPKNPWTIDKMTPKSFERMKRGIFGVSLKIEALDGTWKLSQNKSDAARKGVATALNALNRQSYEHQIGALIQDAE